MPPSPYKHLLEELYRMIFTDPEVMTHSPNQVKIQKLSKLCDTIEVALYGQAIEPIRESNA